ncbi:hypothetical protein SAMD00019534_117970, partial [Acytostelium subglobosum LB1]|uniref:hypothetical protein n=1 Tax=Acytostelium subglobosum LB1 TaxID=1410327 RepID=UPI00064486E8
NRMSRSFCINGTMPTDPAQFEDILVHMDGLAIALGIGLALGGVASTLPQHYKIIKSKSAAGLSPIWLLLGNINQFSAVVNAFILKYPQIDACSKLGFAKCAPSLLAFFQLASLWLFTFPIFMLYILFTPYDLRRIFLAGGDLKNARREYKAGKVFFLFLILFLIAIPIAMAALLYRYGPCRHTTYIFGYGMGILSTVITFVQWSPQIYKTFRAKKVGTLSIAMMCIQCPGTILTIYFMVFVSHESVSTWLSYLSAALQMAVLLTLLFYYRHKNKKASAIINETGDNFSDDSQASFTNYLAATEDSQPLLKRPEQS